VVTADHPIQRRSYARMLVASGGMNAVALVCAVSGLAYGAGSKPRMPDLLIILTYGILICPYFLSREVSLEGRPRSADEQQDLGLFIPFLLFIIAVIVVVLLTLLSGIPFDRWVGSPSFIEGLALSLILSVCPFAYLFFRTGYLLRLSPDSANRERLFKNKVLLPALATCLVSFSFGWGINNRVLAFDVM
jgi:hypothetical protein